MEEVRVQECSQASSEQQLSQVESRIYHKGSQGEACTEQELPQSEAGKYQEGSQGDACSQQELSLEEAGSYHELSDWDECTEEELSHGDAGSYLEVSDWEECTEQGLSQGRVGSSQKLSDWEEYSEHELSQGDFGSYHEVSDWEESMGQEHSEEKDSIGQEVSTWENAGDQDLAQESREQSIGDTALLEEEDEWDQVNVLELLEEGSRGQSLAGRAGVRLPRRVPRQAWVEHGASEACPQGPLCASPPPLEAPAPTGHTASPAVQEQEPEAGTRSPVRSLRSRPCPPVSHLGALALSQQLHPPRKRGSILRRALRSLFCCCLAPQPED